MSSRRRRGKEEDSGEESGSEESANSDYSESESEAADSAGNEQKENDTNKEVKSEDITEVESSLIVVAPTEECIIVEKQENVEVLKDPESVDPSPSKDESRISKKALKLEYQKKKKDPAFVPRSGKFFLHDDREDNSETISAIKTNLKAENSLVVETPVDEKKTPKKGNSDNDMWRHDKFEQLLNDLPKNKEQRPTKPKSKFNKDNKTVQKPKPETTPAGPKDQDEKTPGGDKKWGKKERQPKREYQNNESSRIVEGGKLKLPPRQQRNDGGNFKSPHQQKGPTKRGPPAMSLIPPTGAENQAYLVNPALNPGAREFQPSPVVEENNVSSNQRNSGKKGGKNGNRGPPAATPPSNTNNTNMGNTNTNSSNSNQRKGNKGSSKNSNRQKTDMSTETQQNHHQQQKVYVQQVDSPPVAPTMDNHFAPTEVYPPPPPVVTDPSTNTAMGQAYPVYNQQQPQHLIYVDSNGNPLVMAGSDGNMSMGTDMNMAMNPGVGITLSDGSVWYAADPNNGISGQPVYYSDAGNGTMFYPSVVDDSMNNSGTGQALYFNPQDQSYSTGGNFGEGYDNHGGYKQGGQQKSSYKSKSNQKNYSKKSNNESNQRKQESSATTAN